MTNPSHILIARPSASLSSPTETHAAAAGIFRSSWELAECDTDDLVSELSLSDDEEAQSIDIDPTFTKHCAYPGTVKIIVESTTFWAHKQVLFFASPFFEAALSGNWAETGTNPRPPSMSSVITISKVPGTQTEMTFAPFDPDLETDDLDVARARDDSLAKLQSDSKDAAKDDKKLKRRRPDAVIILKEERASTFHDFLKFVYPHLDCTISWNNVEPLMNLSHKLSVPSLQSHCLSFLLTHAAGKPLKAMRIAELFEEEELYRESSRFVLDNPGGWSEHELNTLSKETLLKLEKRRNWFLERVLKIGLTMIAKEYQCCATCPDPPLCARLLEEKWRQAYHAVFRFGPPQPSMVFRYLRMLEGVSPPLALTHLSCQTTAKAFVATLFDRMFSLGVRGSGTDTAYPTPTSQRVAAAAVAGPRRHFLFCTLKNETKPSRSRRSKETH